MMTRQEVRAVLDREPWLRWLIDPADDVDEDDLEVARSIFEVGQLAAMRDSAHPLAVRHSRGDLLTTSYAPHEGGEVSAGRLAERSRASAADVDAALAAMQDGGPHTVHVEADGKYLRGVAVPWGQKVALVSPVPKAGRIAHIETFDNQSVDGVGGLFGTPFLLSHDSTRPTGRILASRSTDRGLEIEVELLGSAQELESLRARAAGGVLAHMSVGFIPNHAADLWAKPTARSEGLPTVTRRGARIREVSLVLWPAFSLARVLGIHARSAAAEARKASSDAEIAATAKAVEEVAPLLARARRRA
jgi:phage head maturation protease